MTDQPKPATLETQIEWDGTDGRVVLQMRDSESEEIVIRLETPAGEMLRLSLKDFQEVSAAIDRFKVALHAIRGTQP